MQIKYKDKQTLQSNPSVPDENKVTADDMNEIKLVVNSNEEEQQALILSVETNTQDITNIKEEQITQNKNISDIQINTEENSRDITQIKAEQLTQNNDIQENKSNITNLKDKKADKKELPTDLSQLSNDNTKFVNETELENAISQEKTQRQSADNNLQSQIETNKTNIQTNADNISALSGKVSTAEGDIGEIKEEQSAQNTSIQNNTEAIEALQIENAELKQENEDLKNNQLTNTPTPATSHYLTDSADARFRKLIPIGRTTQESTTGKNKLALRELTQQTVNGITFTPVYDENGTLKYINVNGTSTTNANIQLSGGITLNGTFTLSSGIGISATTYIMCLDSSTYAGVLRTDISGSQTANLTNRTVLTYLYIANGTTVNNLKIYPMLEESSTGSDYEPYTGGEPAPSPKFPFKLKNTGDNGSVNEKVQNKNIFNPSGLLKATSWTEENGKYTGMPHYLYVKYGYNNARYMDLNGDKRYTLSLWAYKTTDSSSNTGLVLQLLYEDDSIDTISINSSTPRKYTLTSNTSKRPKAISFSYGNNLETTIYDIQLEEGTVATDYVPHEEQTYSIPTQQPMRSIGDVRDGFAKVDGVWNEVHKIGEKVYNGSEGWDKQSTSSTENSLFISWGYLPKEAKATACPNSYGVLLNYFKKVTGNIWTGSYKGIDAYARNTLICVPNEIASTVADFKAWLATNNTKVDYVLKNPTYLPCTEEQIKALEKLEKARTYKNVTHISSEDETPANVELEYVVDTKTYIDNKFNELSNAITVLGGEINV